MRARQASVESQAKQLRYEALIKARKACHVCTGVTNASSIERGIYDCDEIGAWSLWQGNLNTQVLIVGQDWGDVDWFLSAEGRPTSVSTTNKTLVELLRSAGLHIELPNKTLGRGLLFLTNAVLCMKEGGAQAPVKLDWLRNCGTRFLRPTIDLVQPKVVVCLGANAYAAVLNAYDIAPRKLRSAVESKEPDELPGGISAFVVYHCGAYVLNTHRELPAQIEDWKRIGNFLSQRQN
ncbi:MAG: uracil-DNA glycosylase family protein [Pseudorhodoplanes sp.]|nr:uracil-DNA glycosylase family protein [Pseudorhodoplanes sp.]